MTRTLLTFSTRGRLLRELVWVLIAIAAGFVIATQNATLGAIIVGMGLFAVLFTITPLTALVALLALAPMRTLIATEAPPTFHYDTGQIMLVAFIAAWGLHQVAHGERLLDLQWSPVYAVLLVFIAAAAVTVFSAASITSWLREWLKWVQMLVVAAIVASIAQRVGWQWIIFALVAAGIPHALVGAYEFFGGSGADHLLINNRFFRAFGTFGQPNPFGGFMGLLTPLAAMSALGYAYRLWTNWRRSRRVKFEDILPVLYYGGAAGLMVLTIGMSWSRGAWLGLVGSFGVMALFVPPRWWQRIGLIALGTTFIALLWFTDSVPAPIANRITSSTADYFAYTDVRGVEITPANYAVVERLAHWQAAFNMADANALIGVGLGNYEIVYDDYRLLNWVEPLGHAHNYYLNVLAEAGMIGFLSYGLTWFGVFWLTWRTFYHPDALARLMAVGLLGTWSYLSIHSLFDNLYVNNLFLHLGVMLGVLAALHRQTWMFTDLSEQ